MIDPKSLRIGNWVEYCGVGYTQITPFDLAQAIKESNERSEKDQCYKPITLEFNVFDKIEGAEYIKPTSYYVFDIPINAGHHEWWYWSRGIIKGYAYPEKGDDQNWGEGACVRLDYLHELQNLVYALTKRELIYKP